MARYFLYVSKKFADRSLKGSSSRAVLMAFTNELLSPRRDMKYALADGLGPVGSAMVGDAARIWDVLVGGGDENDGGVSGVDFHEASNLGAGELLRELPGDAGGVKLKVEEEPVPKTVNLGNLEVG